MLPAVFLAAGKIKRFPFSTEKVVSGAYNVLNMDKIKSDVSSLR